jgi:hypothetical protein
MAYSYVLALKHDELRRLDDLPVSVDMASRKSCMDNDELSMMSEPHFSSSQSHMIATKHENISGDCTQRTYGFVDPGGKVWLGVS